MKCLIRAIFLLCLDGSLPELSSGSTPIFLLSPELSSRSTLVVLLSWTLLLTFDHIYCLPSAQKVQGNNAKMMFEFTSWRKDHYIRDKMRTLPTIICSILDFRIISFLAWQTTSVNAAKATREFGMTSTNQQIVLDDFVMVRKVNCTFGYVTKSLKEDIECEIEVAVDSGGYKCENLLQRYFPHS